MKRHHLLSLAAAVFPPLALTHCAAIEDDGASSRPPVSDLSPGSDASRVVFTKGYKWGLRDGRAELPRNLRRYDGDYPAEQSDIFSIGYEEGYVRGQARPAHAKSSWQSPTPSAAGLSQPSSSREPDQSRPPEASPVLRRPAGPRLPIFQPRQSR